MAGLRTAGAGSDFVFNQLVPVYQANVVNPPNAGMPVSMGVGSTSTTIPGYSASGGATNAGVNATTSPSPTLGGLASNFGSLPLWQQPMFLVLFFLVIALLGLRFIHMRRG